MLKRLTENHPLKKKFNALEEYMSENKISIEYDGCCMQFVDNVTGESAEIRDLDTSEAVDDFPWMCEVKLLQEKARHK